MRRKKSFIRLGAIPACILWGLAELMALQKSRLLTRRH